MSKVRKPGTEERRELEAGCVVWVHGREAKLISKHQYSSTGHNWWNIEIGGKDLICPEDIMRREPNG